MVPEMYRELVDSFIESSEDKRRQTMILTMIVRHYTQQQALELLLDLPGLTIYQYKQARKW